MKPVHPQHLTWVLLCGLLLLIGQEIGSASADDVREVTAPNSTIEKDAAFLKIDNEKVEKKPIENISDGINAVPLSPEEDAEEKSANLSSPATNQETMEKTSVKPKDSQDTVPEKPERSPKNLDAPSVNAVATEIELLQEDKIVKKLPTNSTETPDEEKGTTKSSQDDLLQYEYPPKGRTLSYKENATNSDNADVLKNTVPSEPKAVKIEEGTDKDGERWIKKQRGISSPVQASRLNKERNLSGSYLPGLAALNTVNSTSEIEVNTDKFLNKYQRRKRPWSAQVNSSDFSIPEETTVWSLASLKSTPKEKHYGDIRPIIPWSTVINKPTTEYQPSQYSSTPASPLPTLTEGGESDWVGFSKEDVSDVPSIKVTSTTTDVPVKLVDANFTSPSSSLNLIDTVSDKETSNETSKSTIVEESSKAHNESSPDSQTLTPEFSNVINESDSSVKPHPSTTTPAISTTVESVKNLSIYPSPISNSVNELHEEEDLDGDVPLLSVESSYNKDTTEKIKTSSDVMPVSTTEGNNAAEIVPPSFNNSNHPNVSKMFSGKDSYAGSFDFSTASYTENNDNANATSKSEENSIASKPHEVSSPVPTEVSHLPDYTNSTTEAPTSTSTGKIFHVTSTMLPDKGKDSSEKSTTFPYDHSPSILTPDTTENEFNIELTGMFNSTHTSEPTTFKTTTTEKVAAAVNITTSQPKEFNEILLDADKSQVTTEKAMKVVTTTSESPSTSTLPLEVSIDFETAHNETEAKTNENINTIEPSDVTEKTILPKINGTVKEPEITSMKDEIKLMDLFNSTEDFIPSTTSKFPGSVYTVNKVPSSSTEDPQGAEKSEEDFFAFNDTHSLIPVRDTSEQSTEYDEKSPEIFSYPMENTTNSEDTVTSKDTSSIQPSKVPSVPELTPNTDMGTNVDEEQDKFPMSEEDTIYDTADPVFTRLLIQANDKELCSRKEQLRDSIIRLFKTNGSDINRKQVVINNLGPKDCLFRNPPSEDGLFPIQVYLTNSQGHNDMFLTDKFIDLWQREGLDFSYPVKRVDKVIGRRKWVEMDNNKSEGKSSLIAAIVISSIAGVCLLFIVILLVIIRKRQKGFNYGQRCTPVSLEDYSLDNISVYNSTRRKAMRASKRSYGNPAFDDPGAISHVVNFATLANFYNNRAHIDEEFTQIPTVSVKPDELPPGVETKNRFANVIPLPETRVTLNTTKGNNPDVDTYINANYVKGAKGEEKFYIACQAPMADTVSDFWQMIWEQQSRLVIMLTDLQEGGVEKSADYLPPSEVLDCHRVFGDLQVTLKKREVREKYVISNLQLKNLDNNLWREVVHLWLTCWPPQGVPSEPTAVIAFLIEARSYIKSKENTSPIVVHCSPGTGRTGTIIAIDICIRDFEVKRTVDVPKTVSNIRKDRAGAVQTKDQYAFIYQVLHLYATKLTGGGLDSV